MNRQEEIVSYNTLTAFLYAKQWSGLVFFGGGINWLSHAVIGPQYRPVVLLLVGGLSFLSCYLFRPQENHHTYVKLPKSGILIYGAGILLVLVCAALLTADLENIEILDYSVLILSALLGLFSLAPLFSSAHRALEKYKITDLLYDKIVLDDWKVNFDRITSDKVFDFLKQESGLKVFKKFAWNSSELRNAVQVDENSIEIALHDAKNGLVTGILTENPTGKISKGKIRLFLDNHLVLERPLGSFSQGWNNLSDLNHEIKEPIPSNIQPGKMELLKNGFDVLRAEVTDSDSQVFLECPYIPRLPKQPKNIIVLCVDALQKDALGLYGSQDVRTPNLDKYFKQGIVYENAWVQGEWTTTNFAHMFTSMYSSHHRAVHRFDGYKHRLPLQQKTLAEVFQQEGWFTYLLSGSQRVSQTSGYDRGFYKTAVLPYMNMRNWDVVYRCLDQMNIYKTENKFMLLHLMDVHGPPVFWSHKRDVHARFRQTNRRDIFRNTQPEEFYRLNKNQVEEFDLGISLLLAYLDQPEWKDNTTVVLLSDHGQFPLTCGGDDPVGQMDKVLSKRILNIPLAIKCPWREDLKGMRIDGFVEVGVDFYASMLELAGLEGITMPYSRSFIPREGKSFSGKEYVICESIYEGKIQRVIRMKDKLYYSVYNWCDRSLPEEKIWELKPKEDPIQLEGEAFGKASNIFNKIVTDLNLVGPGDDPLEFYGTL